MTRIVHCIKLGRDAEGLDFPPYPGEMGKKIFENVSKEAWQEWVRIQTRIVNEYRLNMLNPEDRATLKQQMENHFFGEGAMKVEGYTPEK